MIIRFSVQIKSPQDALQNQTRYWSEYLEDLFNPILGLAYICDCEAQLAPSVAIDDNMGFGRRNFENQSFVCCMSSNNSQSTELHVRTLRFKTKFFRLK
jgi:hypothetical protein